MKRILAVLATAGLLAGVASGCAHDTAGTAVTSGASSTTPASSAPAATGPAAAPADVPGVEATLREQLPADAFVCFPTPTDVGDSATAAVADPAAPRITLSVPGDWASEAGEGDVALTLTGPGAMSALVTIAATDLDPVAAFTDYAAALGDSGQDVQLNTAAAPFCGYSSQRLTGTLRDGSGTREFADRITHIWTNTTSYLVAVHLAAPEYAVGFDAAKTVLMQDFAVVVP